MEPIRVIVADHEDASLRRLMELVDGREGYRLVGGCSTANELFALLRADRPELVIQDVQFPDISESDVLKTVEASDLPALVLVTASEAYAIDAFRLRAADYVLKPYTDERLGRALDVAQVRVLLGRLNLHPHRLKQMLDGVDGEAVLSIKTRSEVTSPFLKRMAVHTGRTINVIKVHELDYIEGAGVYVKLHTGSKTYLLREALGHLEERLDPDQFVRIHRSTIVNVDRVQELKPHHHGEYVVLLTTGQKLKLSRGRRGALEVLLGHL